MRTSVHTGDCWLDLIGAVVLQAVRDARNGDRGAAWWLWQTWPELARRWLGDAEALQLELGVGD